MAWDIDVKEKVYQRLAYEIFFRICNGQYKLGEKLPAYRVIATEAGCNTETVRKAVWDLERNGIVIKTRKGNFVTQANEKVVDYREKYLTNIEKNYIIAKQKVNGSCL